MRRIVFPRKPARQYATRDLGTSGKLAPDRDLALDKPLPVRGNDYPQHDSRSLVRIGGQSAGGARAFVTIAGDLETGAPPTYIRRGTRALNMGAVSNGTGQGVTGQQALDPRTDGGALYIPHQRIPRRPITGRAFLRTVDLTSTIPARGIGAPVK